MEKLPRHWPEYFIEATCLGAFMVSACGFGMLLGHPDSPVVAAIPSDFLRRALMGLAMGGTAIALIFSPWGKQSGAHMNPAVTLTFLRLGKIAPADALGYVLAQFVGGTLGVTLMALLFGKLAGSPSVNFVATTPGAGLGAAFAAEALISFILMTVVLTVSNTPRLARWTGLFAGVCVALFITFEAPVSGMSMNPARTFGSAFWSQVWTGWWIYFLAPPLGMLAAAELCRVLRREVVCAKLHHQNNRRCIFCEHQHEVAARLDVSGAPGPRTASQKVSLPV